MIRRHAATAELALSAPPAMTSKRVTPVPSTVSPEPAGPPAQAPQSPPEGLDPGPGESVVRVRLSASTAAPPGLLASLRAERVARVWLGVIAVPLAMTACIDVMALDAVPPLWLLWLPLIAMAWWWTPSAEAPYSFLLAIEAGALGVPVLYEVADLHLERTLR